MSIARKRAGAKVALLDLNEEAAKAYADELTESGIDAICSYDDGTLVELARYLTTREY